MKLPVSLVLVLVTLTIISSAPEGPQNHIPEEILKQLSMDGEKLVEEEVRRALYGVKQMKEVMWRNQLKHRHLMESLRRSGDKKKGAAELAQEVREKLWEAEQQCRDSLQSEWEECRPCLEGACKSFYASTCRRGFATFQAKVEKFFHRVSSRFGTRVPPTDAGDIAVNRSPDNADSDLVHIEESFTRLMGEVRDVVNRSVDLVSVMSSRMDQALQRAFLATDAKALTEESTTDPYYPARDSGFLQGVGLDEVLDSFFDFGKSVVEEFGAVVKVFDTTGEAEEEDKSIKERPSVPRYLQKQRLCRDLRKETSECWRLQDQCEVCQGALLSECPSVRELHVELDEVSQLVDVSQEQYNEVLSIVKRHADETVSWLRDMAAEFSWVARTESGAPEQFFHMAVMEPEPLDESNASSPETKVEVNILNSPPLLLRVPGELELQDPAFIHFVAQEALDKYKNLVRYEDE